MNEPGGYPDPTCYDAGDTVVVHVTKLASAARVTGGQFIVTYDPACMEFDHYALSAAFPQLLYADVQVGSIFLAVGIDHVADPGVFHQAEVDLAVLYFTKLPGCGECRFCFDSINPMNTILTNDEGNAVDPLDLVCSEMKRLNGELELNVPDNVFTNPDCDFRTAIVTWGDVTADDSCDEDPPLIDCDAVHDGGEDITGLLAHGGEFPQGTSTFSCTATNSCGDTLTKEWTVVVSDQHSLDLVVQLNPMVMDEITRCIEFEFFFDCVQVPYVWQQELFFGGAYDFVGHATPDTIKIPKGQYACVTARDVLHSLRSVSLVECVDNVLVAEFKGDPDLPGGNWLVLGNLDYWKANGNGDTIDILDFGMFVSEYEPGVMKYNAVVDCDEDGPHGDINGDGYVDSADFVFVAENFLTASKNSCCDDGIAGAPNFTLDISCKELVRMGMQEVTAGDLNFDGRVNMLDFNMALEGNLPSRVQKGHRSLGR
jgi:hypothetical protein